MSADSEVRGKRMSIELESQQAQDIEKPSTRRITIESSQASTQREQDDSLNASFFREERKENSEEYKGEPLDANLISGPISDRTCTDFVCAIVFLAFIGAFFFACISGFISGNPQRLATPYDSDIRLCGYDDGYTEYPYIYYPAPRTNIENFVCVKDCPGPNTSFEYRSNSKVCADGPPKCQFQVLTYETGTKRVVKTCIPVDDDGRITEVNGRSEPVDATERNIYDLKASFGMCLGAVFASLFIGYLFLFLIKKFPAKMTYASLVLVVAGLGIGGYVAWSQGGSDNIEIGQKALFAVIGLVLMIAGAVILLYIVLRYKKIRVAVQIIQTAAQFTEDIKRALLLPVAIFLVYFLFLIFWFLGVIYTYSSGSVKTDVIEKPYEGVSYSRVSQSLIAIQFIALIWISQYFSAFCYFVVASATSMWYFTQKGLGHKDYIRNSVMRAFKHTGTLALGSIILTFAWIFKGFLALFHLASKSKRQEPKGTPVNCPWRFCITGALCYEAYFRYLSKQAYIQVAVAGQPFFKAAHDGFYLMRRFEHHFDAVNGIGVFILFMGQIVVCAASTILSVLILNSGAYANKLYSTLLPSIFIGIITYYVGSMLMSLYGTAADTVLQCYCIDEELNARAGQLPRHIPDSLKQFMEQNITDKKDKAKDEEKKKQEQEKKNKEQEKKNQSAPKK